MRRGGGQFRLHQRKMGAGEGDGIHPVAARLIQQTVQSFAGDRRIERIAAQLRFGKLDERRRSMAKDGTIRAMFRRKPVDIRLTDRGVGAEDAEYRRYEMEMEALTALAKADKKRKAKGGSK